MATPAQARWRFMFDIDVSFYRRAPGGHEGRRRARAVLRRQFPFL